MSELLDSLTEFFFLCEHVFDRQEKSANPEVEIKALAELSEAEKNK